MQLLILLLVAALVQSCGGAYTVEVKPVEVNVKAEITLGDIMSGFKVQCRREDPLATEDQVATCASSKLTDLLMDIDSALNP